MDVGEQRKKKIKNRVNAEKKGYIHTSQCVGVCVCADEGVNDVRVT